MQPIQNKGKPVIPVCLFILSFAASFYAAAGFLKNGFFADHLFTKPSEEMLFELGLLFLWLLLFGFLAADKTIRNVFCLFGIAFFLWIHRIFLPVVVSGFYCGFLYLSGEVLLLPLRKKEGSSASRGIAKAAHNYLTGCAFYIVFICILSAAGFGSLHLIRRLTGILAVIMLLLFLLTGKTGLMPVPYVSLPPEKERTPENERTPEKKKRIWKWVLFSLITVLFMLQAGRLNIALDYDSLHYGLRTPFILNGGHGIYENLGSVNEVYFYSKGFEILAMPLSGTPTYGFVLSFSWWNAVFVLAVIYGIVKKAAGEMAGITAAFFAACIPGIMNMAVSAKPDMGTLLFQLIFLNEMWLCCTEQKENIRKRYFLWGFSSLLLSLTMKPTAFVFSTAIFITAVLYLGFGKKKIAGAEEARKEKPSFGGHIILLPLLSFCGVMLRTFLLTGYPVSSVFTSIFSKIGMKGKFPIAENAIPNAGAGKTVSEIMARFGERLRGFLLFPAGADNRHVLISWGTVLFPVLLFAILLSLLTGKKREKAGDGRRRFAERFLLTVLAVLLVTDIVSLFMLWQIDGNYYMMTYALTVIAAVISLRETDPKTVLLSFSPAIVLAFCMTVSTNWAGVSGFTPVSFYHYGFYDHASDVRDAWSDAGAPGIYEYLLGRPESRVLAFAEEPRCYSLPCSVQSYTDMEGSGGNVALAKTLNRLRDYLDSADMDYLYTEESFLSRHSRAEEIIRYLKEEGSITEIMESEGNTLYAYNAGIRD